MKKVDLLLIYPQLGSFDALLRDIPLSLIYVATDAVKRGYNVKILDLRLHPDDWQEQIDASLKSGCFLVGLSVMTGNPIKTSLKISQYVKEKYNAPVVWGGAHPTVLPEQTLENKYIDYVIRDWGSKSLCQLLSYIKEKSAPLEEIVGLGYKKEDEIVLNQVTSNFEIIDYPDIPYHLIEINKHTYNRLQGGNFYFPIYTAVGCPYKCSFCISPTVYKKVKGKKWIPFSIDSVLDHIAYLLERYDFQCVQVYDDDSFVDLQRMKDFFVKYIERGFHRKIKLAFRGIRINELDKMDDDYLKLMVEANVEFLEIGVESGSDNTLERMRKGITVEQILRVSRKLSNYPSLRPVYNIFCGTPGETYEDLVETKNLMETLVKDNPSCMIGGVAADWKPLPGSLMTDIAVKEYDLELPRNLEEWGEIDSLDAKKIQHPWYTRKINNYIKMLQVAGQVMDRKIELFEREVGSSSVAYKVIIFLAKMYRPILGLRLKYNFTGLLFEYPLRNFIMKSIGKVKSS